MVVMISITIQYALEGSCRRCLFFSRICVVVDEVMFMYLVAVQDFIDPRTPLTRQTMSRFNRQVHKIVSLSD